MYHPLWQAEIDGAPASIYPSNLVMRGLVVPAGASAIELRYVPFLTTASAARILAFGLLVTGLVGAFGIVLTRRDAHRAVSGQRASILSSAPADASRYRTCKLVSD